MVIVNTYTEYIVVLKYKMGSSVAAHKKINLSFNLIQFKELL